MVLIEYFRLYFSNISIDVLVVIMIGNNVPFTVKFIPTVAIPPILFVNNKNNIITI